MSASCSFGRRVWEKVKLVAEKTSPENWLIPSAESKVTCQLCFKSDIALMKCFKPDCKQYCCVDCAFKTIAAGRDVGLALYDGTDLKVECDYHFGSVLYCTCRTIYSDAEEMVLCDSCEAWFHNDCVGYKASKKNPDQEFTCPVCIDLRKPAGTRLSAETRAFLTSHKIPCGTATTSGSMDKTKLLNALRQKNKEDDAKFQAQSDAFMVVGPLVNLVERMELLDEIHQAMVVRHEFGGVGDVTEDQLNEVMDVFSSAPWNAIMAGDVESGEDVDADAMVVAGPPVATAAAITAICDVSDLLKEYLQSALKYQKQLAEWDGAYHRTLRSILHIMTDLLKAHRVPASWDRSDSSNDADAIMDTEEDSGDSVFAQTACLFDVELFRELVVLNTNLQELVGAAGSDKKGRADSDQLQQQQQQYPLPVRPSDFDSCALVARVVQHIMDIFGVYQELVSECSIHPVTGKLTVTNSEMSSLFTNLNNTFSNGNTTVHTHLTKDRSLEMAGLLRYTLFDSSNVSSEHSDVAMNATIAVDARLLLQSFYRHLHSLTFNCLEVWVHKAQSLCKYVAQQSAAASTAGAIARAIKPVSTLYDTISEGDQLSITVDLLQTLREAQHKCISTERSVLYLHSSSHQKSSSAMAQDQEREISSHNRTEDDRTTQLHKLRTRAISLPFAISSLPLLEYLIQCNSALSRYETVTTTHSTLFLSKYQKLGLYAPTEQQDRHPDHQAVLVSSADIVYTCTEIQDLLLSYNSVSAQFPHVIQANKNLLRRNSSNSDAALLTPTPAPSFPLVDTIVDLAGALQEDALSRLTSMREDIDQLRLSTLRFLSNSPAMAQLEKMLHVLETTETTVSGGSGSSSGSGSAPTSEMRVKYCIPEESLIAAILQSETLRLEVEVMLKKLHSCDKWTGQSQSHSGSKPGKIDLDDLNVLLASCEANMASISAYEDEAEAESEDLTVGTTAGSGAGGVGDKVALAVQAFETLEGAVSELKELSAELSVHWTALKQLVRANKPAGAAEAVDGPGRSPMVTEEEFRSLLSKATSQTTVKCDSVLSQCEHLLKEGQALQAEWVVHLSEYPDPLSSCSGAGSSGSSSAAEPVTFLNDPKVIEAEVQLYSPTYCALISDFYVRTRVLPIKSEYKRDISYRHGCSTLYHSCRHVLSQIPSLYVSTSDPQLNTYMYNRFQKQQPIVGRPSDLLLPYKRKSGLSCSGDSNDTSTIIQGVRSYASEIQRQLLQSDSESGWTHLHSLPPFAKRFMILSWRMEVVYTLHVVAGKLGATKDIAGCPIQHAQALELMKKGRSLVSLEESTIPSEGGDGNSNSMDVDGVSSDDDEEDEDEAGDNNHNEGQRDRHQRSSVYRCAEWRALNSVLDRAQQAIDTLNQVLEIYDEKREEAWKILCSGLLSSSKGGRGSSDENMTVPVASAVAVVVAPSAADPRHTHGHGYGHMHHGHGAAAAAVTAADNAAGQMADVLSAFRAGGDPSGLCSADVFATFRDALACWNTQPFVKLFSDVGTQISALPISLDEELASSNKVSLQDALASARYVDEAYGMYVTIHECITGVRNNQAAVATSAAGPHVHGASRGGVGAGSDSSEHNVEGGVVQLRDLQYLVAGVKKVLEKESVRGFRLLSVLQHALDGVVREALVWEQKALLLLPQRATRTKTKVEVKTVHKSQLELLLTTECGGLAKVVAVGPVHSQLITNLNAANKIRRDLRFFLLQHGNHTATATASADADGDDWPSILASLGPNLEVRTTFESVMKALACADTLKMHADLLTFELSENRAIEWVLEVYTWYYSLNGLLQDPETAADAGTVWGTLRRLAYADAVQKQREAYALFRAPFIEDGEVVTAADAAGATGSSNSNSRSTTAASMASRDGSIKALLSRWGLLKQPKHEMFYFSPTAAEHLRTAEYIFCVLTEHLSYVATLEKEVSNLLDQLEGRNSKAGGGQGQGYGQVHADQQSQESLKLRVREIYTVLNKGEGRSVCLGCAEPVWGRLLKYLGIAATVSKINTASAAVGATGTSAVAGTKRKYTKHAAVDDAYTGDGDADGVYIDSDSDDESGGCVTGAGARTGGVTGDAKKQRGPVSKLPKPRGVIGAKTKGGVDSLQTLPFRHPRKCLRPGCSQPVPLPAHLNSAKTGAAVAAAKKAAPVHQAGYCSEKCISLAMPELFAALLLYRDSLGGYISPTPPAGSAIEPPAFSSKNPMLVMPYSCAIGDSSTSGGSEKTTIPLELQREIALRAMQAGMRRVVAATTTDPNVFPRVLSIVAASDIDNDSSGDYKVINDAAADDDDASSQSQSQSHAHAYAGTVIEALKMTGAYPTEALANVITITAPVAPAVILPSTGKNKSSLPFPPATAPRPTIPLEITRAMVRQQLEDSLYTNLVRHSSEPSPAVRCVVLAADIEEVLCGKYMNVATLELNKKDYQQHCRKIRLNIKEPHNCPLIIKLLNSQMTVAELLSMDVDDFASAEDKALRAKNQAQRAKESTRLAGQSTEAILEARRTQALAGGEESWRGDRSVSALAVPTGAGAGTGTGTGTGTGAVSKTTAGGAAAAINNNNTNTNMGNMSSGKLKKSSNSAPPSLPMTASRAAAVAEAEAAAAIVSAKGGSRGVSADSSSGGSIDIDSSMFSRFSRKSDDDDELSASVPAGAVAVGGTAANGMNKYVYKYNSMSERDVHPSMLNTPVQLVCSGGTGKGNGNNNNNNKADPTRLHLVLIHQPKDPVSGTASTARPKRLQVSGTCVVKDQRVQGLLPSGPIECKLKAPTVEVNKSIGVAISSKRRIVACFQMLLDPESEAAFQQYSQLYGSVNDRMLAWEVRDGNRHTTLSIVPPSLVSRVDILRGFVKDNNLAPSGVMVPVPPQRLAASNNDTINSNRVVLYGIITAKQWGEASYFQQQADEVEVVPFVPVPAAVVVADSNSNSSGGGKSSSSSSSFMNQLYN